MGVPTVEVQTGSGSLVTPLPFGEQEFQRRLDGVRAQMAERSLDAFVSFTPENLYYLSAHNTPGYYFYQAMVVTMDQGPINVLRRIETANTLGRGWKRQTVGYEDRDDPVEKTLGLLHELGVAGKKVGAEGDSWFVSPNRYAQLRRGIEQAGGTLSDASRTVESLRVIKSPDELALIRQGCRVVEAGTRVGIAASREGTNENEVAAQIVAELIRQGGEYAGLPPFITSGPRTSMVHSTWDGRVFQQGDVLNFELPGVIKRYTAALFRSGTVGQPSDEVRRQTEMVVESLEAVIAAMKPGATSGEVHEERKRVFAKYGEAHRVGHRTGYSVGVNYPPDWGEGHILSIWEGDPRPLRPGMTFHLVPGFYELGRYGIVQSETVLITETGSECLTQFSRDLFIV
jgi:Xaa-Pro dipeptidase